MNVLSDAIWPTAENVKLSWVKNITLVVTASLLLSLSAKIHIPMYPVPMTMQTFMVVLVGAVLGARRGASAVLLYLGQGLMGWPVFSGTPERGIGLAYMMGPTGGYLLGFLLAAILVGVLAERGFGKTYVSSFTLFLFGQLIIFAVGLSWLSILIGFESAVTLGLTPFLLAATLKLLLGVLVLPSLWEIRS
jgi:biotin transport system substrate-specific component